MNRLHTYADPVARVLMSSLFVLSGLSKVGAPAATHGYMVAFGVPSALFWPTAALEVGAGILLILGLFTRPLALVLAAFSLLTAAIFHNNFGDQIQTIMFLKNLVIAGGFVLLAKDGAPAFSLGARLPGRKAVAA